MFPYPPDWPTYRPSSVREWMPIFAQIRARFASTVFGLMNMAAATLRLVIPAGPCLGYPFGDSPVSSLARSPSPSPRPVKVFTVSRTLSRNPWIPSRIPSRRVFRPAPPV